MGRETRNVKRNYAREAKRLPLTSYMVDSSSRRNQVLSIVFTQEDSDGVHYPNCDALVVRAIVARNGFKQMLVDNSSSVNILIGSTFDKMILDHELTRTTTPLYGFIGDSITPRGKITLVVEMGESPQTTMNFMKFLIVDSRSAYHRVLDRPALKELGTVTSIHHLCIKLPTENGVITVKGNQRGSRECYLSSIRNGDPRDVHAILTDADMADIPSEEELSMIDEIDPRVIGHEPQATPIEELENFPVNPRDPAKVLKVGIGLSNDMKERLKDFLCKNLDIFAWRHEDMVGIDPKACPKDSFPLPRIDQLVDSTAGHELLSFMDAYSGYNQIPMYPTNEENISFITDRGLYCYKMMLFGLKNAGATYQRLVNRMFVDLIGKTMEVYVDDMLVKSLKADYHVMHLDDTFRILMRYKIKLNPLKYAFGVASSKFLGYMVNQRVLKARKKFEWNEECEEAFQVLKKHLRQALFLSKPKPDDILQLYLAISNEAISASLT
ncbi:uncharacterized protein LOC111400502 [Olea europaea var. sylvestris]|uniref:uncharacterized protein LOC111400502 n=1 Tax=Olea europaea var. sylvestris TaxID=158386 RepID=UPI000C1D12AF|nr:uncharacterized protein LOC111400502 [Olea europaea var. sylvestris]